MSLGKLIFKHQLIL